jgi:hypothetical protein
LFVNLTQKSAAAVFIDNCNAEGSTKVVNCSFEDMQSTGNWPAAIGVYDFTTRYNVTHCFFRNLSCTVQSPYAGAINCYMTNNIGYYNISENTFIEIKTNKSAIQLNGSFSSLIFSYNSFYNVSSVYEGGVFKFDKYIYLFYI